MRLLMEGMTLWLSKCIAKQSNKMAVKILMSGPMKN